MSTREQKHSESAPVGVKMICLSCHWTGHRSQLHHDPCPTCGSKRVVTVNGWAHTSAVVNGR